MKSSDSARRVAPWGRLALLIVLWTAIAGAVSAQSRRPDPPRAVPKFGAEVNKVFFPDASKLLGPGGLDDPSAASASPAGSGPKGSKAMPAPSAGPSAPSPAGVGGAWSSVVPPDVIEDEIKAIISDIAGLTKAKGKFKSSGYKEAEVQFANLAVLFGVVANYDGDIRWKAQAGAARDMAAKVGFACKEGSDSSYEAAKNDGETLTALVRGDKVDLEEGIANTPPWPSVADIGPLMKRLEKAIANLKPMAADKSSFDPEVGKFMREAGVVAMLGRVLQDSEYNEEDSYKNFAAALEAAGTLGAQGAKQKQYDAAKQAVTTMDKTCNDCHNAFR